MTGPGLAVPFPWPPRDSSVSQTAPSLPLPSTNPLAPQLRHPHRCEATLTLAPPLLKAQMAASLSYVHTSWSNANL